MKAVPLFGFVIPVSILIVVVLPAPFGPKKPKSSPFFTSKLMLLTANISPKFFVKLLTSIAFSVFVVVHLRQVGEKVDFDFLCFQSPDFFWSAASDFEVLC